MYIQFDYVNVDGVTKDGAVAKIASVNQLDDALMDIYVDIYWDADKMAAGIKMGQSPCYEVESGTQAYDDIMNDSEVSDFHTRIYNYLVTLTDPYPNGFPNGQIIS